MTTAYYQAVAYHSLINYLLQMSGCAAGRPVGRSMGPIVTIYHLLFSLIYYYADASTETNIISSKVLC